MPNATGTVFVTATKVGDGFQIEVQPWLVAPNTGFIFNEIVWAFSGVGAEFTEVSLNFGPHDNFEGTQPAGNNFVLTEDVSPPGPGKVLTATVKDPDSIPDDEFEYRINFQIDGGPKVEIDPGYRVKP